MMRAARTLTLLSLTLAASPAPAASAGDLYVATGGSDANPGTKNKPLATLARARDEARRRIARGLHGRLTVWIGGGTYRLAAPVVFGPEDSGSNAFPVVYAALPGEKPTFSGGRRIAGWKPAGNGRWQAPTEVDDFRQLYVNGSRRPRARGALPDVELSGDLNNLGGDAGYLTRKVEMAGWRNPRDIELGYYSEWSHMIYKVMDIRKAGSDKAFVLMQQPDFHIARKKEGKLIGPPAYIENALELCDEPGEWYLDRSTHTAYVIPKAGEDLTHADVVVPELERLLELRGTLGRPVHDLQFEGLTFADAGWLRPNREGLADVQANFVIDSHRLFVRKGFWGTPHNEYIKSPANVVLNAAHGIRFSGCTFERLGGAALDIERGSRDNAVEGCDFHDISGSGIQVGDVLDSDHHPVDERLILKNNRISNNYIHDIGAEYHGSVGIFVGYTDGTRIAHNEITSIPYSAISVGWGWGEEDVGGSEYKHPFLYDTPTSARDNLVEANYIHDILLQRNDGAGVYTLGRMPGTVISRNVVHDVKSRKKGNSRAGIYLDEGSADIEVRENIVYDVPEPTHYNNLRDPGRRESCKEVNNSFDVGPDDPRFPTAIARTAGLEPRYRKLLAVK